MWQTSSLFIWKLFERSKIIFNLRNPKRKTVEPHIETLCAKQNPLEDSTLITEQTVARAPQQYSLFKRVPVLVLEAPGHLLEIGRALPARLLVAGTRGSVALAVVSHAVSDLLQRKIQKFSERRQFFIGFSGVRTAVVTYFPVNNLKNIARVSILDRVYSK